MATSEAGRRVSEATAPPSPAASPGTGRFLEDLFPWEDDPPKEAVVAIDAAGRQKAGAKPIKGYDTNRLFGRGGNIKNFIMPIKEFFPLKWLTRRAGGAEGTPAGNPGFAVAI